MRWMSAEQALVPVLSMEAFDHFYDSAPKRCERGQTSYNGECLNCHASRGENCLKRKRKA